jgi:hypothetical protein
VELIPILNCFVPLTSDKLITSHRFGHGRPSESPEIEAFAVQNQAAFAAKNTLDKRERTARFRPIDMKDNPLTTTLLGVLTVSALTSVVLCWLWASNIRDQRELQRRLNMINSSRMVINSLANEAIEYSKKNPAIDPILESVGLKPAKSAPTTTNIPATK